MRQFLKDTRHIYLALGATDFRKQTAGLAAIVTMQFQLDPFADQCVFLFCNRKKNSIKILRYDSNGFILAGKTLLDGLKFQRPKATEQVTVEKLPRGKQRGKFFFGSKIAALNFRKLFGFRKGLGNDALNPALA